MTAHDDSEAPGGNPGLRGSHYGMATAGNNLRVHLIRQTLELDFVTMCGSLTPRRPQTTQDRLPKCRRCFGEV